MLKINWLAGDKVKWVLIMYLDNNNIKNYFLKWNSYFFENNDFFKSKTY